MRAYMNVDEREELIAAQGQLAAAQGEGLAAAPPVLQPVRAPLRPPRRCRRSDSRSGSWASNRRRKLGNSERRWAKGRRQSSSRTVSTETEEYEQTEQATALFHRKAQMEKLRDGALTAEKAKEAEEAKATEVARQRGWLRLQKARDCSHMSEAQAWVTARSPSRVVSMAQEVMSMPLQSAAKEKHPEAAPTVVCKVVVVCMAASQDLQGCQTVPHPKHRALIGLAGARAICIWWAAGALWHPR